jgi:hypothetical protein
MKGTSRWFHYTDLTVRLENRSQTHKKRQEGKKLECCTFWEKNTFEIKRITDRSKRQCSAIILYCPIHVLATQLSLLPTCFLHKTLTGVPLSQTNKYYKLVSAYTSPHTSASGERVFHTERKFAFFLQNNSISRGLCNKRYNSLMFVPCIWDVVEMPNNMHWFYLSFILYTGYYMFR